MSDDKWLAVTMEANSLVPAYRQKRPEEFFHSTVLVLVGTEDGRFGVLDLTRGTLAHAVQAHSTGAVRSITCMEEDNYVITTGCGGTYVHACIGGGGSDVHMYAVVRTYVCCASPIVE